MKNIYGLKIPVSIANSIKIAFYHYINNASEANDLFDWIEENDAESVQETLLMLIHPHTTEGRKLVTENKKV